AHGTRYRDDLSYNLFTNSPDPGTRHRSPLALRTISCALPQSPSTNISHRPTCSVVVTPLAKVRTGARGRGPVLAAAVPKNAGPQVAAAVAIEKPMISAKAERSPLPSARKETPM